jgi:uncharacterized membrane protein (DUF4010 family)
MHNLLNTLIAPYLLSLIVATGLGLIIGLEREFRKTNDIDHFAGIRTFPLVSILGCIITFVGQSISPWVIVGALISFIILVGITYYTRATKDHRGITTEISLIITFILGAMTSLQLIREALAAAVITTTLLSLKGKFHSFVLKLTEDELFAFIKFIVLSMLLLPFLPDTDFGPNGILNPQEIGIIVVVVSSLSFIGYLLIKFTGTNKGILLTAFFGGLFSSTALTWMFSSQSRTHGQANSTLYAAGIVLASSIMFLRVVLISLIFNAQIFLALILPCTLMWVTGMTFVFVFIKKQKQLQASSPVELGNPVSVLNALGFGLLYTGIALMVFYTGKYFGNKGLLLSGLISGMADVDAITINMAKLAARTPEFDISVLVIVIAMMSNTIIKLGISVAKGSPEVKRKVALALFSVILSGLAYMLITLWS